MQLSENAIRWLASGERGLSSETMFSVLTGVTATDRPGYNHPHDFDDLRRCERLLRQVPELRGRLELMLLISPVWARLVEHWNEIVTLAEMEAPGIFEMDIPQGYTPITNGIIRICVREGGE